MEAPKGWVSHISLTNTFQASETWKLRRSVFEGPVWVSQARCHKKGDVSMEPGDLEILGISSDEILTRELVTARFNTLLFD